MICLLILPSILTTSMLVSEAQASAGQSNENLLFTDNFESYSNGTRPSPPWEFWFNTIGCVVETTYVSPSKSLWLRGSYGWSTEAVIRFSSKARYIGYEVYGRVGSIGGPFSLTVGFAKRTGPGTSAWYATINWVIKDGNPVMRAQDVILQNYVANKWYKMKVIFDRDKRTYDVWIDDVLKASSVLDPSSDPYAIEGFNVASEWAEVDCYFDDVKVFEVTETSFPFAWKNDTTFGIENSHLKFVGDYKHYAYPTPINPIWWEYIYFKDTATNWTSPWGDTVAVDPSPLWADKNSVEVQAINQSDKAIVLLTFTMTNSYGKLLCKVSFELESEAYIKITANVTNLGTSTNSYTVRMGLYTYIAGDTSNDYFYIPGVGQGQYTGTQKDLDFKNYTEPWIAAWDSNKNQGAGVVFTKGFKLGDNVHIHDWYSLTLVAQGAWVGYVNKNINAGETSENYECYIYFFSGTGYEKVSSFYHGLKITRTNPTVTLTPNYQLGVAGSTLTYTVSITNNDPVDLGPSTFSLTCSVPSGWSASLSKTSVTLNPGETDSSIIVSVTSPATASAGEYTISVTVTNIEKSNIQASGTALYVLQKLLDMILKAHEACQALEEGILDGAEIVDKETLGTAVEALKTSIDFIPVPSGSIVVKLGGQVIKMGIKDLLNKIKDYGGNNLYSYYSNGYFSSTMESIKEEILSLNSKITEYNVEELEKIEFIKDMMNYFDDIKLQGEYYPKNLNELVEAHGWEKFNRDLIFCGGGIFIIIITAGAATPYIVVFNGAYHAATGIYNIADESQFYETLSSALHGFHAEALYYVSSINESLHYVTRKLDSGDFSFPKITVVPSLLGGGTIKNEYDKPVKIKVVFNVHLMSIPRDQTVAVPERHYSVCLGESIVQPQSSYIFIKPNPPQDIQEWIRKLKSFGYDVDEMVGVTIFYGEDEIYAMKGMLLPKDGSIINLEEVQHKLFLHVFDAQNRHVGMNYETKRIEIEITGAYYLENLNNITIVLPSNITDFKIIVDAKFAEEKNEAYNLTIHIINGTKIINTKQILSFLEQGTSHKYDAKIFSDGTVSMNLSSVFWKAEHWYMIVSIVIVVTTSFLILYRRRKKIKSKKTKL